MTSTQQGIVLPQIFADGLELTAQGARAELMRAAREARASGECLSSLCGLVQLTDGGFRFMLCSRDHVRCSGGAHFIDAFTDPPGVLRVFAQDEHRSETTSLLEVM